MAHIKDASLTSIAAVEVVKWPLHWLPLAWFSLFFLAFVLGRIGAAIQGDPMAMFLHLMGVRNPAIVGIALHEIGMMIAVGILLVGLRKHGISLKELGLHGPWSWQMICSGVVSAVVTVIVWPLVQPAIDATGIPLLWWSADDAQPSRREVVWLLITAGILSPLLEELIFRGYVLNALLTNLRRREIAILLQVLIVMSIHILFGPGMIVMIFFWSFVPTLLVLRFKSLYPAILMHILNNLFAYLVVPLL